MSATLHPNMFPGVAELTAADELAEAAAGALPSEPASETHFASNISPWANPSESLQKAATPGEVASGEETAKQPTTTERVAKYLRTHGPSSGRAICDALGIHSTGGIQPFIKAALRKGHILHEGVQYMLPEQRTSDASDAIPAAPARGTRKKAAPPVAQAEQRGAEPVATTPPAPVAHALGTDAPPKLQPERTPDFTLTKDDAMLVSWPDGAITVQRGGSFVELTAHQAKLICTLIELRR